MGFWEWAYHYFGFSIEGMTGTVIAVCAAWILVVSWYVRRSRADAIAAAVSVVIAAGIVLVVAGATSAWIVFALIAAMEVIRRLFLGINAYALFWPAVVASLLAVWLVRDVPQFQTQRPYAASPRSVAPPSPPVPVAPTRPPETPRRPEKVSSVPADWSPVDANYEALAKEELLDFVRRNTLIGLEIKVDGGDDADRRAASVMFELLEAAKAGKSYQATIGGKTFSFAELGVLDSGITSTNSEQWSDRIHYRCATAQKPAICEFDVSQYYREASRDKMRGRIKPEETVRFAVYTNWATLENVELIDLQIHKSRTRMKSLVRATCELREEYVFLFALNGERPLGRDAVGNEPKCPSIEGVQAVWIHDGYDWSVESFGPPRE